ncbi:MAG: hypothetical protein AAF649_12885, partial [Verrucomicrobiota bacterium]
EISREDLAEQLLDLQLSGGTGGEVLTSVCARLLKFELAESDVYKEIKGEASELIGYANSIGYRPHPY